MFRAHVASLVLFVSLFLAGRAVFRTTVDSERTTFSSVKVSSRLTKVTPGLLTDPGGHRAISGTGCTLQEDLLTAQLVEVIGLDGQSSWLQHTSLKVEPTDLDLVDHEESTSQDDAPPIDKLSKNDSSKTNGSEELDNTPLPEGVESVEGDKRESSFDSDSAKPARGPLDFSRKPAMRRLHTKIKRTLNEYYTRHQNARDHCPWAIMHSIIAWGVDTQLYLDRRNGQRVSAIGWLCFNGRSRNERLFSLSQGKIRPHEGPGLQGHQAQFLAMLAQSKVKRGYPMRISERDFTIDDLIEYEKSTCYSGTELTFKLISLSHYLSHDEEWKNDRGETWTVARILKEELGQPIRGAACGGTHRLMGYSYSLQKHIDRGHEVDGQWLRAKKFTAQYHKYAFSLQNRDGSFSCNWFDGTGDWYDDQRKIQTTGHILEWLVYSLPEKRLEDRRIVKAVNFVASMLYQNRYNKVEVGPLGHALKSVVLYEHRVFGQGFGHRRLRYDDVKTEVDDLASRDTGSSSEATELQ